MKQLTPIGLVQALAERIRIITQDLRMEESDGNHVMRAPNVWAQNLPEKLYEDVADPADYPFVLVMLGGGTGIVDGRMPCHVGLLIGGYDDGQPVSGDPGSVRDRQGWLLPAAMTWRIITSLASEPTIGPFALILESLTWELPGQDQPEPYWYGIINTTWSVPVPEQDYNLDNTQTRIAPPCEASLSDDITTFMEGM